MKNPCNSLGLEKNHEGVREQGDVQGAPEAVYLGSAGQLAPTGTLQRKKCLTARGFVVSRPVVAWPYSWGEDSQIWLHLQSLDTEGQVGYMPCMLVSTPAPPPPAREGGLCAVCGFVFLVQLCFQFQD